MWRHFVFPHPETHQKAHLVSIKAFLIYIALFLVLQNGTHLVQHYKPDVLGVSTDVNKDELISLTNKQRQAYGLSDLKEDSRLDQAAYNKAQNMFTENYWAHYSPSGKDPWGFIQGSGYQFSYAGENLARNFYTSSDVVNAWMNSASHKENIINSHYQNIGMAVVRGKLLGQDTVLVVQEFGTPVDYLAKAPEPQASSAPVKIENISSVNPEQVAGESALTSLPVSNPIFDANSVVRNMGIGLILFVMGLLLLDMYIMRRRAVTRLSSRTLPHMGLLSFAAINLIHNVQGTII
jgi:hypothetical protein